MKTIRFLVLSGAVLLFAPSAVLAVDPAAAAAASFTGNSQVASGLGALDKTDGKVEAAIERDARREAAAARSKALADLRAEIFGKLKAERSAAKEAASKFLSSAEAKRDAEKNRLSKAEQKRDAARAALRAAQDANAKKDAETAFDEARKAVREAERALRSAESEVSSAKSALRAAESLEARSERDARRDAERRLKDEERQRKEEEKRVRAAVAPATTNDVASKIKAGYYLATLRASESGASELDLGSFGPLTVHFKEPAARHWYSLDQISNQMVRAGIREGAPFNYHTLYRAFYDVNANPDLTVDLKLTRRDGAAPEDRQLGVDLDVKDAMPLHVVLALDNFGSGPDDGEYSADKWMGRATVQYLNLWEADHALTLNALTAVDGSLYGGAASYFVPLHLGRRDASLTVHGGYTEVGSDDVVPQIDVKGTGWFAGVQGSVELLPDWEDSLRLAVGLTWRNVWDQLVVHENGRKESLNKNEVDLLPLSVALLYTGKGLDSWMGRNYATIEAVTKIGGSDEAEMRRQRFAAEEDYWVGHLQLARVQTVGGTRTDDGAWSGRGMIFAKVDAQVASGALVSAEQMGVGGANSVRGFGEREFLGDHGVSATLEYRTPILLGGIGHLVGRKTPDRLQFVAFCDMGWVGIEEKLSGEEDEFIASLGLGLRSAWGEHALFRLDWGVPVAKPDEYDGPSAGRAHLSLQAQF